MIVGLWRYCTEEWTRLSLNPVDRKNRHQDRSLIHPWWQEVQQIDFHSSHVEAVNRSKIQPSKDIKFSTDMMAAYALTLGTLLNRKPDALEEVIAFAHGAVEGRLRQMHGEKADNGQNLFEQKMKRKRAEIWPLGYVLMPV